MRREKFLQERIQTFLYGVIAIMILLMFFGNKANAEGTLVLYGELSDARSVLLKWESDSAEDVFQIQKKEGTGSYTVLTTVSGQSGTINCYDDAVKLGHTYSYKIVRVLDNEMIQESNVLKIKVVLARPSEVRAERNTKLSVKLSWNSVEKATGYTIYRSNKKTSGYEKITTTKKNTYTDYDVANGKSYYYKLVSTYKNKKQYTSEYSEIVYVHFEPGIPNVVGNYNNNMIKLTWKKVTGADKYYIYKRNTKGKYIKLGETKKLNYKDADVEKDKTYRYKVVAVRKVGGKTIKGNNSPVCTVMASAIDPNKKMVALTYDDGPGRYTEDIVNCLKDNQAKATFFVLGCNVDSYKDALIAADKIGCEIGNHSYSHSNLTNLSVEQISAEITKTDQKVEKVIGKSPTLVRTPGGAVNSAVKATVNKPIISWSVDTLDWKHRNSNTTIQTVMNSVKDGDIILMHDIHEPTKIASLSLIPRLRREGYQLVTVSELAKYRGYQLKKGEVYYSLRKSK